MSTVADKNPDSTNNRLVVGHPAPKEQRTPEELVAAGGGRAGVNPDTSLPAFSTDSPVFDAPVSRR